MAATAEEQQAADVITTLRAQLAEAQAHARRAEDRAVKAEALTLDALAARLPEGDLRIEAELVHGGWCGYVLISRDNGPIEPATEARIYARTTLVSTRAQAIAEIPATVARIAEGGE